MQLNTQWWEIANPWYNTGNEQYNIYQTKIKGSGTRYEQAISSGVITRGEEIDRSIAYARVDSDCPWTNYTVLNKADNDSMTVVKNDSVPLVNYLVGGYNVRIPGAGYNQNFCLMVGHGDDFNVDPYKCAGWYNSLCDVIPYYQYSPTSHKYIQITPNFAGLNPIGKFGGKAYILTIMVYCSQSISDGPVTFTLKEYCEERYQTYPYIRSVYVVPYSYNVQGNRVVISVGHVGDGDPYPGPGFAPLTDDLELSFSQGKLKVSTWDAYLPSSYRQYQNIFGYAGGVDSSHAVMYDSSNAYMSLDEKSKIVQSTSNPNDFYSATRWSEIASTIDGVREYFKKSTAYFGLFFSEDYPPQTRPTFKEDTIMLGLMDANGVTHGKYSVGSENEEQFQFNSKDIREDSKVDPISPPDPSPIPESNPSSVLSAGKRTLGTPGANIYISTLNQFTQIKIATETKYAGIIAAAESGDFDTATSLASEFGHTQNPNGCFYTVLIYPFDITKYLNNLGSTDTARIGKSDYKALTNFNQVSGTTVYGTIDCGQIFFPYDQSHGGFNNPNAFTNYAPYTSASLTLPFCGTIKIDPTVYSNCYIGVKYLVDWRTGVCQALIHRSTTKGNYGVVMETVNGQMAYRINLSADNASNYANDLLRAASEADNAQRAKWTTAINYGATAVAAAKNMAGGGVAEGAIAIANAANKIVSAKNTADIASYSLETKEIPLQQISSANPAINTLGEMKIRLNVFKNPIESNPIFNSLYGHTIGFATLEFGKSTNRKGYTVMDSIDTNNISVATEQEKAQIKQLVKSGVYFGEPAQA